MGDTPNLALANRRPLARAPPELRRVLLHRTVEHVRNRTVHMAIPARDKLCVTTLRTVHSQRSPPEEWITRVVLANRPGRRLRLRLCSDLLALTLPIIRSRGRGCCGGRGITAASAASSCMLYVVLGCHTWIGPLDQCSANHVKPKGKQEQGHRLVSRRTQQWLSN